MDAPEHLAGGLSPLVHFRPGEDVLVGLEEHHGVEAAVDQVQRLDLRGVGNDGQHGHVRVAGALDHLDFEVGPGEVHGVVGTLLVVPGTLGRDHDASARLDRILAPVPRELADLAHIDGIRVLVRRIGGGGDGFREPQVLAVDVEDLVGVVEDLDVGVGPVVPAHLVLGAGVVDLGDHQALDHGRGQVDDHVPGVEEPLVHQGHAHNDPRLVLDGRGGVFEQGLVLLAAHLPVGDDVVDAGNQTVHRHHAGEVGLELIGEVPLDEYPLVFVLGVRLAVLRHPEFQEERLGGPGRFPGAGERQQGH